jgi:hypothetical protein
MRCVYEAGSAYHDGAYFDLYVLSRSGLIEQVKHWWAGPGDVDSFTVASRVAPSQIDALQVRAPNGTTLLVYQP